MESCYDLDLLLRHLTLRFLLVVPPVAATTPR